MTLRALAASAQVLYLMSAAVAALAAPTVPLTGFNGVEFGTPFKAAKQRLGAKAKAEKSPSAPIVNTLLQLAFPLYGESFGVNYTFGTDDRLKAVYAIADVPTGDYAVCQSHWNQVTTGLKGEYGAPDTETSSYETTIQSAETAYSFANGAKLDATLLGCLIMVTYFAPGYSE